MKTSNFRFLSTALIVGLLYVSSCSKSDDQTADTTNGERASETENVIQDAISIANDGLDGTVDGVSNGRTQACATVTNDATAKILTIDFGTAGCVGIEGRTRKGKIAIQYVGAVPQTSPTRSITFTNYSVNNNVVNGTISVSGFARSTATAYSFSVSITGLQVALSDGRTYSISNLQRTYNVNLGASVQDVSDDATTITGTSTQTGSSGTTTTIEITSPITYNGSCTSTGNLYPSSGIYKITEGNLTYTIDWGTGVCDKSITVTALGKTTVKILP
jgi:hypothetical protein